MFLVLVSSLLASTSPPDVLWPAAKQTNLFKWKTRKTLQPWKLLEQSQWKPLFPVLLFFFFLSCVFFVVNKFKSWTFFADFFFVSLLWIWLLFYFCWSCVYLLHEYQSVHWFLFTFCLTLTPLFVYDFVLFGGFFCHSSDDVIKLFVKMSIAPKKHTGQVGDKPLKQKL